MDDIELPWSFFNMHGLEFNGQLSFLKAGLYYADHITAVSPTYAREITEPQFAYGMEGLLRQRHLEGRLSGILNGVDEKIWNPESDLLLASRYTRDTLEEKAENKRQLQIAMGLKVNDKVPLFAVVSRLTNQKGLDLVLEALPGLLEQGGQLALLGAGDPVLQEGFLAAAAEHPGQVGVDLASGFVFEDSNAWSLLRAIRRAFVLWSRPSLWRFVQRQAMAMDFSWQVAAKSYRELYYRLK